MHKLDSPYSGKDFISIIVLSFQRAEYTFNLLQSLHNTSDMPMEIIVVDDASSDKQVQQMLYQNLPATSTVILNSGGNRGFTNAANQATALCNSDYVLLLNNDIEMVGPGLPNVASALELPYVGCLGVMGDAGFSGGPVVRRGNLNIELNSNPRGSGAFAFRKEVWSKLGGFPERHHSAADIGFFYSMLKNGYFNGFIADTPKMLRNRDQEESYANPTEGTSPFANGYPMLFGTNIDQWTQASLERRQRIHHRSTQDDKSVGGINNIEYWHYWFQEHHDQGKIIWEKDFLYGQEKFRPLIERDLAIGGAIEHG
jgi:glycosyltransferase involved in cell wall biosynthesis